MKTRSIRRLLLGLALILSACAQLPTDLPPRPDLLKPATGTTLKELSQDSNSKANATLNKRWWESFGQTDLNRLIETALHDHPDLVTARTRLRMADQAERLARLQTDVRYETEASIAREKLSSNGLFPPPIGGSSFTRTTITQTLSYNLDWWDKNRSLVRAAGNEQQAAQDEDAAIRLNVAAAVADAYFASADIATRLAISREIEQIHRKEHDLLKIRFDLGLDSLLPLVDARKKLDLDEDMIHELKYQDRSLRYRISALLGSDPDHAMDLPAPSLKAQLPSLPTNLPLDWLAQRPDVAALRSRVAAAADFSAAAKADFYPNLDLRLMLGLETLRLNKLLQASSLATLFGPALQLPIFNGQTLRAKLGMREADYAAAVAAYNSAILEAARQAADACTLLASLEHRSQSVRKALQETEQIHTLAKQRQQLGLADPLDALQANSVVLVQSMHDIEIQAARLRAHVALYKALGGAAPDKEMRP